MNFFKDFFEFLKPIVFGVVLVFLFVFINSKCEDGLSEVGTSGTNQKILYKQIEKKEVENKSIDSLTIKIAERLRSDSLNLAIQLKTYKNKYLKALSIVPDTLKIYIKEMNSESEKKDSIYNVIIARKDSTISEQQKKSENLSFISAKKDTIINAKSDSLKLVKKLVNRKYWGGFRDGTIFGSVGTALILGGANTVLKK